MDIERGNLNLQKEEDLKSFPLSVSIILLFSTFVIRIFSQKNKTHENVFLTSCFLLSQITFAQYNYPNTPEKSVTDDYFGTKITDNYQWLEDLKSPEVKNWFKAQSDYSHSVIDKIPNRDELYKGMKQIQEMGGDTFSYAKQRGNFYFYTKTKKNEKLSKLYVRDMTTGKESLLFDPETYKKIPKSPISA